MDFSKVGKVNGVDLRRAQGFKFNLATKIDILPNTFTPNEITVCGWCNFVSDTTNNRQTILNKSNELDDVNRFIIASSISVGDPYLFLSMRDSGANNLVSAGTPVTEGIHHFTVSVNTITNEYIGYIDGVVVFTGAYIGTYTYNTSLWRLGGGDSYYKNSNTQLWGVKIYDSILTASEINEEMRGNILPALGYWPLQYNTKDYSGNSNNGTVTGTEQYEIVERGIKSINGAEVLGKRGLDFDGGSYSDVGYLPEINGNRYISVNSCIKTEAGERLHMLSNLSFLVSGSSGVVIRAYNGYIQGRVLWWTDGSTRCYLGWNTTNTVVQSDTLHNTHVCIDAENKEMAVYIDGIFVELVTTYTVILGDIGNASNVIENPSQPTWLGAQQDAGVLYSIGILSNVKIWNYQLTESQIKEEMKGNVLPALGYWPLQEDTKDYSNNSNNGTVTGTEQYKTIQNGLTDWKDPVLP